MPAELRFAPYKGSTDELLIDLIKNQVVGNGKLHWDKCTGFVHFQVRDAEGNVTQNSVFIPESYAPSHGSLIEDVLSVVALREFSPKKTASRRNVAIQSLSNIGVKQNDIAEALGVSQTMVSRAIKSGNKAE